MRDKEFFEVLRGGNFHRVNDMLKRKEVKPDIRDLAYPSKPTPLIIATEQNSVELAEIILHYKPDVNLEDKFGKRAIWWAVKYENLQLLDMLLKRKAKVNFLDKEMGCTPLYLAILKNHAEMAQMLVHAGGDVNLRKLGFDALSETPLIKAVQQNNTEIVKLLINCLADINSPTKDGLTSLHYAVAYRRYEITEVLLSARVKMYAASKHGVTAMTVAVEHDLPYMCNLLAEFGYDLKRPYSWGETPLEQAISLHSEGSAIALLFCGVPMLPRRDKPRYSYFQHAVAERQLEVARLILYIKPTFSQERWVREGRFPVSIYQHPDFREWLERRSQEPWTLQEWCRSAIFRHLKRFPLRKIKQLPGLPKKLRRYLCFHGIINTKHLYRKVPLTEKECPFDCQYFCERRMCPPLDIEPEEVVIFSES